MSWYDDDCWCCWHCCDFFYINVYHLFISNVCVLQDTNNENLEKMLKQCNQMFDLCGPMKNCATAQERHLFMEGDLRYKDSISKVWSLTQFVLNISLLCLCGPVFVSTHTNASWLVGRSVLSLFRRIALEMIFCVGKCA